jgi:hypothetical protein
MSKKSINFPYVKGAIMKHTPGPWSVVYSEQGYPQQIDAQNGSDGPGGITSITRWAAISFPSSTEGLANARLIAAAPDLLNALEGLEKEFRRIYPIYYSSEHWCHEINAPLKVARAAIAKATGECA